MAGGSFHGVVIAPTRTWKRSESSKTTGDVIKDSPDRLDVEQKLDTVLPFSMDDPYSTQLQIKVYQDMRMIHRAHVVQRQNAIDHFNKDELCEKKPMNGVSLPQMELGNQALTRGLSRQIYEMGGYEQ